MSKESTVKVSLDLNEELREYAVKRLAQFRTGIEWRVHANAPHQWSQGISSTTSTETF